MFMLAHFIKVFYQSDASLIKILFRYHVAGEQLILSPCLSIFMAANRNMIRIFDNALKALINLQLIIPQLKGYISPICGRLILFQFS